MEIRIRTHEELRTDRVTIEITGTGAEVTEFAEAKLYTDGEVANLQASEAELVAGPLRRRIAELERALADAISRESGLEEKIRGYDHDRHTERDRADRQTKLVQEERTRGNNLAQRLAQAEKSLAESRDLVTFKNRILNDKDDELRVVRGHADRLTREHEARIKARDEETDQRVKARDRLLNDATTKIENARVILLDSQIKVAQDKAVTKAAVTMAEAIGRVLDTLA